MRSRRRVTDRGCAFLSTPVNRPPGKAAFPPCRCAYAYVSKWIVSCDEHRHGELEDR
jgi:hypothetical protein